MARIRAWHRRLHDLATRHLLLRQVAFIRRILDSDVWAGALYDWTKTESWEKRATAMSLGSKQSLEQSSWPW